MSGMLVGRNWLDVIGDRVTRVFGWLGRIGDVLFDISLLSDILDLLTRDSGDDDT